MRSLIVWLCAGNPDDIIPGSALKANCPEPAVCVVNTTTMLAVVRSSRVRCKYVILQCEIHHFWHEICRLRLVSCSRGAMTVARAGGQFYIEES